MMKLRAAGIGLSWVRRASVCPLFLATVAGCMDGSESPPITDDVRPVKTLLVSAPSADAGIELPGKIRAVEPVDLAFKEVQGTIVELPIAGREGQEVLKGELLAQIDPEGFAAALSGAEGNLSEAYSVLDLARAEDARMEEMKGINPDLVSASMLERTQENLSQAEARLKPLEAKVEKAEDLLEDTSLRAPFTGILARCLVKSSQSVKAGEPVVSMQDTTHLEVLVDAPEPMLATARELGADGVFATVHFAAAPDEAFPLQLKGAAPTADPTTPNRPLVLEMPKPQEIDLPPGTTGTVTVTGEGTGVRAGRILVPAIAVMTDPNGQNYLWLVSTPELRVQRLDVQIGRLAGSDQIQVLSGLAGGERIVVAGVMQLAEGRQVRLWEDREAGKNQ